MYNYSILKSYNVQLLYSTVILLVCFDQWVFLKGEKTFYFIGKSPRTTVHQPVCGNVTAFLQHAHLQVNGGGVYRGGHSVRHRHSLHGERTHSRAYIISGLLVGEANRINVHLV